MGIGLRRKRKIVCTGSRPTQSFRKRKHEEFNCIKCNVTLDVWAHEDEPFANVVECPSCQIVFDRYTGKILIDRTKENKEE